MPLQGFIDSASSLPVVNGARKVKSDYLPNQILIDNANPLSINSSQTLRQHFNPNNPLQLTVDQVSTYLSTTALLHSIDGWVYISHAIESLLKGDDGVAIHLAYYSELRATMSFLASEGIGIFDFQHLCLNNVNQIIKDPLSLGTHKFIWKALDKWIKSTVKPTNTDLLTVFNVYNKTFLEWSNAFPYSSPNVAILVIKKWLRKWNFDIQLFQNDRKMRNEVSYQPQRLKNTPSVHSLNEIIDQLNSFWYLLEPHQSNRFQSLDKYLLRIFLQELYNSFPNAVKIVNSLESLIVQTMDSLGLNRDQLLIDFLKDTSPITNNLFVRAKDSTINAQTGSLDPLSIIARATLMLRISTGNVSLLYNKAGISKSELDFLWERIGTKNGFWKSGHIPIDFEQLWDEIKDYIDETSTIAQNNSPSLSLSQIYEDPDMPLPFNFFKQFHRVALWGLNI